GVALGRKCRLSHRQRNQLRRSAAQEEEAIVGLFREYRAARLGSVPNAALVAPAETRAVPQRRITKGGEEKVIELGEFGFLRKRRLAPIDQLFQQSLLGVRAHQLQRRGDVLRFDHSPRLELQLPGVRESPALRP